MDEAFEELISLIEIKYNEHEHALTDLNEKYADGSMFDNDDSSMIDYHEGATEALYIILHQAKEIYGKLH
jgi:hypothetical protein